MTEPEAPESSRPGGAHRRTNGRGRLPVLLLSLVAIAVAAVVVVIVLRDRGEPAHTATSPKPTHASPGSTSSASRSGKPTPSPLASPVTPITSGNPTLGSASPSTSATASSSPPAAQPSSTVAPAPAVDVLNDSTVSGLAARAATRLRGGGWQVGTVGNYDGANVPATTIFYPGGAKAAAQRLAAQYGVTRVLSAAGSGDSGLSASDLTLVLARDWKDAG